MGSVDRSKKRIQLWKKAILHFSLCFVMGFFTGFAPTSTAPLFSGQAAAAYRPVENLGISARQAQPAVEPASLNRSLMTKTPANSTDYPQDDHEEQEEEAQAEPELRLVPEKLLVIITTTRSGDPFQVALLRRLANTLRLVRQPLLWIVVEAHADAPKTAGMLRSTGIMYRHLTFKENFTDAAAEADHQRNVALNHIEYHRLDGIVHFASVSNVYHLRFFEELRDIEVFGTWPVVMVSANRKRVVVEGPVCSSSRVVGWQLRDLNNGTRSFPGASAMYLNADTSNGTNVETRPPPSPKVNISGFAFNSSILWDPERWGRPSSIPDTSQDSIKFVQQVVLEDEAKLRAIPPDCSQTMMWHLHIPRTIPPPSSHYPNIR